MMDAFPLRFGVFKQRLTKNVKLENLNFRLFVLMGCVGPLANDGDIAMEGRTGPGAGGTRQCHQTFVPLNGCWERGAGRDSYPVGMVCTICCECSAQLAAEMRRSRGWTNGYRIGQ
ncbi:hypothetical protein niasHS_011118 [Heterodera schachtii]|uniref:Uncharacterized protein n=1 Tax=Heterodera schachtii TaxID=97005 RepID=A0ABD2IVG6_HETSC